MMDIGNIVPDGCKSVKKMNGGIRWRITGGDMLAGGIR